MSAPRTIDDFRVAHDPTFKSEYVGETFHRKIDWRATKRAIVVSAQNATPVDAGFWAVLLNMSRALSAEILVIPARYKNPTSMWTASQRNADWYAPEVRAYLWNVTEDLNANCAVIGDLKVQPTNSAPLSGAETLSGASSAVVGHTRAVSQSVATPQNKMAKWLATSGAVTQANYSDTRIGRLANFHHSLSAQLIELKGGVFFMRRLNYCEKSQRVIDLGTAYYAARVEEAPPALALVMGDTHVDFVCPDVVEATFGVCGMVEQIRPKHLVWHDLLDGYSCNPHHRDNPFHDIAKWYANRASVSAETERACQFLDEYTAKASALTKQDVMSVVVPSNHDDFLARWIIKEDWKKLPAENRAFYLRTALHMAENTKLTPSGISYPDPFISIIGRKTEENIRALAADEDFSLAGVSLHMHGDVGPNGARGSRKNIRRVSTKSIIGHSHAPGEDEGCVQVGTSTRLRLEYNGGPSSWLNAHCILNADGKRQLVTIVGKEGFCL